MRALLASPLGFLIGVSLGALGGGGSILAVPALVYAAGLTPKQATAASLVLVGVSSLVAMGAHWRAGRVRVGTGVAFGLAGIGGSLAGSRLNAHIDPDLLLLAFAGLVLVAAWRMLAAPPSNPRGARGGVDVRQVVAVLAVGTVVGFLTGLFGVGGGFVIVPALVLVLKLPMPDAVGTSLLVIAINSVIALAGRWSSVTIDWGVTVPFVVAAVAGAVVGGKIADRLDPVRSGRWFAALLVAVAVYTGIEAGFALAS